MNYKLLGDSDLKVSTICLGTMTFGEQNDEADGHEQLDYALAHGVNFIDTAELYSIPGRPETQGSTESIIGTWIHKRNKRDDFMLATKIAGPSPGLKYIREDLGFGKRQLNEALEASLTRLQTDYIDLYQLHWPERKVNSFGKLDYTFDPDEQWEDNFMEALTVLQGFINDGKIRYIGVSNETPWGVHRILNLAEKHNLPKIISIQNPYSLLNRSFDVGLAEMCMREHMGLLAYSPLGFGMLTGKYFNNQKPENARLTLFPNFARYSSTQCMEASLRYNEIAKDAGMSLAQLALAFINTRPWLGSNIIGATNIDQLKENISSVEVDFKDELLKAINEVHGEISNPAP